MYLMTRETKGLAYSTLMVMVFAMIGQGCQKLPPANSALKGNLSWGKHEVGFQTIFDRDKSKAAVPFSDWDGHLYALPDTVMGRPYQINIWYPAKKGDGRAIHFDHYIQLMGRQVQFEASEEQRAFANDLFIQQTNALGGDGNFRTEHLEKILRLPMAARLNADPLQGPFPLVLYPNGSSPAFQCVTAEFLASHGFVVVGVASKGRYASGLEVSTVGLQTAADDVQYVLSKTSTLPFVEANRIGLIANAISASVCALVHARNQNIDALVSLEGGLPSAFERRLLKDCPAFAPSKMRAPMLFIYAPHPSIDPAHTFDFTFASRSYAHFPDMSEFVMLSYGQLDQYVPDIIGSHEGDVQAGFETANELVLKFFTQHLLGESTPLFEGIDTAIVDTTFQHEALVSTPNIAELKDLFLEHGFEVLDSVYWSAKSRGLDQPFDFEFYVAFRDWLAWKKDPQHIFRKKLYELAADSYPNRLKVRYNLAYYQELSGSKDEALQSYHEVLDLIRANVDVTVTQAQIQLIRSYVDESLGQLIP